jgi:hypothetical protein
MVPTNTRIRRMATDLSCSVLVSTFSTQLITPEKSSLHFSDDTHQPGDVPQRVLLALTKRETLENWRLVPRNGISGKWLGGKTTVLIVRTERFGTRYFLQSVTATDRLERTAHHPRCRWFSDRGLAPRRTRALPSADRAAAPASRSFLRCSAARNKFCSPRRSAW